MAADWTMGVSSDGTRTRLTNTRARSDLNRDRASVQRFKRITAELVQQRDAVINVFRQTAPPRAPAIPKDLQEKIRLY
jgi:hypothetical protein